MNASEGLLPSEFQSVKDRLFALCWFFQFPADIETSDLCPVDLCLCDRQSSSERFERCTWHRLIVLGGCSLQEKKEQPQSATRVKFCKLRIKLLNESVKIFALKETSMLGSQPFGVGNSCPTESRWGLFSPF